MAPIPAVIQINFTSNYPVGCHRVYYRVQGSGLPYTQITVNCTPFVPPGSQACVADIPITVDNESCNPVTYEGYIQPCCEADDSLNNRVPFTVTFTPNPVCRPILLVCNNVGIQSVNSVAPNFGGSGYDPLNPPAVNIIGGGGSGAIVNAIVGNTGVDGFSITSPGSGYTDGSYSSLPVTNITGSGTSLLVDLVITGGSIVSVNLSDPSTAGTGYNVGDTFTVTDPSIGAGTGLVITVTSLNTGKVIYYVVVNSGTGYSSVPIVNVDPSPGIGFPPLNASAQAELMLCPRFDAGNNCDGTPKGQIPPQFAGTSFELCYTGGIEGTFSIPGEYTVTEAESCCYDCRRHSISFTNNQGTLTYTDCSNMRTTTIDFDTISSPYIICAVVGSVAIKNDDMSTVNVVVTTNC